MKIKYCILYSLIWLVLGISSCSPTKESHPRVHIEKFPIEQEVRLDSVKVEPVLYFLGDMLMTDSLLITIDIKNDTLFQYFSLPNLNYCGASTIKGGGPDDEQLVFPILQNEGGQDFTYRSIRKVKIVKYCQATKKLLLLKEFAIPDKFMNIANFCKLNNTLIGYGVQTTSNKEYKKLDLSNDKVSDFGPDFPNVGFKINKKRENILFSKNLMARRDGERFAALYDKFPLLRIYDKKGYLLTESEFLNHQIQPTALNDERGGNMDELTINYLKLKVTDRYIYGLYVGKRHKEVRTSNRQIDDYAKEVHVWDWDGKPIARFLLNKAVSNLAVSQDDEYLLFSSYLYEDRLYKMKTGL